MPKMPDKETKYWPEVRQQDVHWDWLWPQNWIQQDLQAMVLPDKNHHQPHAETWPPVQGLQPAKTKNVNFPTDMDRWCIINAKMILQIKRNALTTQCNNTWLNVYVHLKYSSQRWSKKPLNENKNVSYYELFVHAFTSIFNTLCINLECIFK